MKLFSRIFLIPALTLLLCAPLFASAASDAWKLRRSDPQQALTMLQQAVREDPNDAKAYWFMAMIHNDLGQGTEGLQALDNARRIDPALGFASSPESVGKVETALRRKAGGSSSGVPQPRTGSERNSRTIENTDAAFTLSRAETQEMLRQLQSTGVYVSPGMQREANAADIAKAVAGAETKTNVVVIDALPARTRSVGQLAQSMHKFLNINNGKGLVIAITGRPRAVGIYGGMYLKSDKEGLTEIAQSSARTFEAEGYAAGVQQIVRRVDAEEASSDAAATRLLLIVGGGTALAIFLLVRRSKKKRAAELTTARESTRDLSTKLAPELQRLDSDFEYALLGADDARKAVLQNYRQRAGQAFSEAMKRTGNAQTAAEFNAARYALQNAQAEMQRARNVLEGKPEDEGVTAPQQASGALPPQQNSMMEIPPLGADYDGAQNGYALDYFTSQPVPRDQMVPVDLNINGQQRRVWASAESAQRALAGQPQIATMNYGGQQRAWFDVPQYNPWQDFGSQVLQMMAINMMINSMMGSRGWGGGYNGGYSGYDSGWNNDYGHNYGSSSRDNNYDNRMESASHSAGEASLDSPMGGGFFDNSDSGGSSSLDVFGGGSYSGSDRS